MAADFGYGIGETCFKHPNSSYICPCNGVCEGSAVPSHAHSLGHFWGVNALHWDGHVKWELLRWVMRNWPPYAGIYRAYILLAVPKIFQAVGQEPDPPRKFTD